MLCDAIVIRALRHAISHQCVIASIESHGPDRHLELRPPYQYTLYIASAGAMFRAMLDCRRRVRDGGHLGRAPWKRAFCERLQNRFVRLANNLPLAARRSLGHIGLMETWPSG